MLEGLRRAWATATKLSDKSKDGNTAYSVWLSHKPRFHMLDGHQMDQSECMIKTNRLYHNWIMLAGQKSSHAKRKHETGVLSLGH